MPNGILTDAVAGDAGMTSDLTPTFALAPPGTAGLSRYAKLRGKFSRFLARNMATRKLPMNNIVPLITFSFDDAPASACDVGAQLLERCNVHGTFFISGGGCGQASPCGRLATAAQVKELFIRGHEIGCHTYSHIAVSGAGDEMISAETERNRSFLQGIHPGITVRNFAYPYGDLSFRTKLYLEKRFDSCRSLHPGINIGSADLGALKTCALENSSIDRRGVLRIVAETVQRNGWLVFTSHDVDDNPSRFGVSPGLLEFALTAALAAGARLVTTRDAVRILAGSAVH